MNKKIICFSLLFIMLFFSFSSVFAASNNQESSNSTLVEASKSTLEVVDKSICEQSLSDIGNFKKELTSFDKEKKELTITLTVTNTAKKDEATKPVEIFLVLDNSSSMTKTYQNKTKMEYVVETANLFTDSIFEHFDNAKIGVVSFSSLDEVVNGEIDPSVVLGTINDATLLLPLSDSKDAVKSTISSYASTTGPRTNIEAGLSLAQSNFPTGTSSEKYVILISDGVPNLSLDDSHAFCYSGTTATNTKKRLQDMEAQGYHIFSVLTGSSESNVPNPNAPMIEDGSRHMTYHELAEEIFGTVSNPTVGNFYYIDYENLDTTVNENIYNTITYVKDNTLKNIVIKDYIPQKIIDNFDFEYVTKPNIGTVTEKVDTTDNSITWKISELKEEEVATLSYKLKLKTKYNKEIVNTVLPTNTKVEISFETSDGKGNTYSEVSPKVKVTIDNTVANNVIPQTGSNSSSLFAIIVLGIVIFVITRIVYLRKIK